MHHAKKSVNSMSPKMDTTWLGFNKKIQKVRFDSISFDLWDIIWIIRFVKKDKIMFKSSNRNFETKLWTEKLPLSLLYIPFKDTAIITAAIIQGSLWVQCNYQYSVHHLRTCAFSVEIHHRKGYRLSDQSIKSSYN